MAVAVAASHSIDVSAFLNSSGNFPTSGIGHNGKGSFWRSQGH